MLGHLGAIALATADFKIYLTDSKHKYSQVIKTIDLGSHSSGVYSTSIKNLVATNREIFLNTYKGDFIRISLSKNEEGRIRSKERRLMNLVSIEGEIIDLTMVEKEDERLTFICFNENYSVGFSSENHDIIDHFMVHNGESFTAIESAILDEDQIILFYGTKSGAILVRENWSEEPHVV